MSVLYANEREGGRMMMRSNLENSNDVSPQSYQKQTSQSISVHVPESVVPTVRSPRNPKAILQAHSEAHSDPATSDNSDNATRETKRRATTAGTGAVPSHSVDYSPSSLDVGLSNLGNTCFMNAALQCLLHVEPLTSYFLTGLYSSDICLSSPTKGAVATSFARLLSDIAKASQSSSAATRINPQQFQKALCIYAPHLLDDHQQDSQEFLRFLLDSMSEDLFRKHKHDKVNSNSTNNNNNNNSSSNSANGGASSSTKKNAILESIHRTRRTSSSSMTSMTYNNSSSNLNINIAGNGGGETLSSSMTIPSLPVHPPSLMSSTLPIGNLPSTVSSTQDDRDRPRSAVAKLRSVTASAREGSSAYTEYDHEVYDLALDISSNSDDQSPPTSNSKEKTKSNKNNHKHNNNNINSSNNNNNNNNGSNDINCPSHENGDDDDDQLSSVGESGVGTGLGGLGLGGTGDMDSSSEYYESSMENMKGSVMMAMLEESACSMTLGMPCHSPNGTPVIPPSEPPQETQPSSVSIKDSMNSGNSVNSVMMYRELARKTGNESWNRYISHNDSVVTDIFCGQLQSTVQCLTCLHKSFCFDPFFDISVPIPSMKPTESPTTPENNGSSNSNNNSDNKNSSKGSVWRRRLTAATGRRGAGGTGPGGRTDYPNKCGLEECLSRFTEDELLEGDNMYSCEKCGKRQKSVRRMAIYRYPEILVIHIKRFQYTSIVREKIFTDVEFPIHGLDLKDYISEDSPCAGNVGHCVYDLLGVVHHCGGISGGHYVAHVASTNENSKQNSNNHNNNNSDSRSELEDTSKSNQEQRGRNWICYNDAQVSPISSKNIGGPTAYILFYKLRK